MKKLLSILLSLMMVLPFAACELPDLLGGGPSGGGPSGGGGDGPTELPDDYDPSNPEEYIYRSVFADSSYKTQWETSVWGAEISNVWDSSVLPEGVPEKPDSVTEVDRTEYVGKLDSKISSNPPGKLDFDYEGEEKYWEYYMVMFTGTEETFDSLVEDMQANFACHDDRDDGMGETRFKGYFHAYSDDLYIYMSYSANGSYNSETFEFEDDGTVSFTIYAIPPLHALPEQVGGVPLMQAGYMMFATTWLQGYDATDEEISDIDYDFKTGTTDALKEYWYTGELSYYGATTEDADEYGTQLISAGFTLTTDEENPYRKRYTKEEISVNVDYDSEYKCITVIVQKGENWY